MTENDYAKFTASWIAMSETLAGKTPTDGSVELCFNVLKKYELRDVLKGMGKHLESNKWMPAPSEIIEKILGTRPSNEELIQLGIDRDTTLGLFVSSVVGARDLKELSSYDLISRVKGVRYKIDEFIDHAQKGEFTDKTRWIMFNAGVSLNGPLCRGLSGPMNPVKEPPLLDMTICRTIGCTVELEEGHTHCYTCRCEDPEELRKRQPHFLDYQGGENLKIKVVK